MNEVFEHAAGDIGRHKKTFYHDKRLPSLPLPSIYNTVQRYLDSCKALLTDEEYKNTKEICDKWLEEESLSHQLPLMQKATRERNWLEKWWLDYAYLKVRSPIMYYYFAGPGPYPEFMWPLKDGSQLERSAIALYNTMQIWFAVTTQIFPQQKVGKDSFLTMDQFRYMFNTTRIPKHEKDEIHCSFKTSEEGEAPSHLIVFFRNRMYKIPGLNQTTGKILTPPEFYKILREIVDNAPQSYGDSVAALTCLERETWADARDHLISISRINGANLKDIEDAVACFSLDESRAMNYKDLYNLGLRGPCGNRWSDKSFNYMCTANGGFVATCDHSPYEAMVLIVFTMYCIKLIGLAEKEFPKPWNKNVEIGSVEELKFDVDDKLRDYIRQGLAEYNKFTSNLEVTMKKFDDFGKVALRKLKIHPDGFVQICIQLAYMRMYGHPAPTYETATTRGFYNGRTETARTCTPEAVAFCKAMIKGSQDSVTLFRKAHDKFVTLMNECKDGQGCDRHLMGIALQAMENEEPLPALYNDPAYTKTGGGGNFVMSTSFTGYTGGTGGVAPMVDHGYGTFYCINNEKMFVTTSAWNSCKSTDAEKFIAALQQSMRDVYDLLSKIPSSNL